MPLCEDCREEAETHALLGQDEVKCSRCGKKIRD